MSFFVLAYVLSWTAWAPYVLSENGLGILHFKFPMVGGTSQLAGVLPGAFVGPILSALLVTAAADGRPGLRVWGGRLVKWRVNWRWYVAVVVGVPAALFFTAIPLSDDHIGSLPTEALVAYVPALIMQMFTTGLSEEPGWRDFALPRMQRRFGPVVGSSILGLLWAVWHFPLFFSDWGGPAVDWLTFVEFTAVCIAFSLVMTWVFNRTRESLPVAILLHTSVNNFFSIAFSGLFPTLTDRDTTHVFLISASIVASVLLIMTRGRLGYRPVDRQPTETIATV
ncbi:CPBP family glutamic-type intramembrane protease [Amycolatopsis pigmentata]|uniref:Type II CAAX prenyl endopeptidase Rce1 family protein n=1 Tax=Amycolatopsis pigmentata TaxID=450801 RepID=A0ABW5FLC0_9PSEU